jgi:hypothetical protein
MRLAILSDIHGNPLALDAVLADIQSQGKVDARVSGHSTFLHIYNGTHQCIGLHGNMQPTPIR